MTTAGDSLASPRSPRVRELWAAVGGRLGATPAAVRRRDHLLLFAAFVMSRIAFYAAGLRFELDLSWMFLSDPLDLKERLLETVFYFHAFAPGMNLITGVLSKLGSDHLAASATALFLFFGWVLLFSVYEVARRLRFSSAVSVSLALAISLLPQSLFFENLYLYTYLCTALSCLVAVLLHRAIARGTALSWFWCFLGCAVLGWLYTTFHFAWFLLMLAFALVLSAPGTRRAVLLGAAVPGLLILALYTKNKVVFGVFGATSWGGGNLTLATTWRMDRSLRARWIAEGKLSPYAALNVYSPPRDYLPLLPDLPRFPWPGSNELWRPSVAAANFNHGLFLQVNQQRARDAAYYIKAQPLGYLKTVFGINLPRFFHSTTHWHPLDGRSNASHYEHRLAIGAYERWYDRLVHRWPADKAGLYVFFPVFYLWALREALRRLRTRALQPDAETALFCFCVLQIGFITTASALFTSLESSRYRYAIEPFIWIVVALGLKAAREKLRALRQPAGTQGGDESALTRA